MTTKTRFFLEDVFVLLVFACIVYAVYYFFFSSDVKKEPIKNQVIEKKIQKDSNIPLNKKPDVPKNIKNPEKIEELKKEEKKIIEKVEKPEKKEEKIIEKVVEEKSEPEKNIVEKNNERQIKISSFYKEIRDKIYSNIKQNVIKDEIIDKQNTKIRITILKDGMYEQLTFIEGSKEYYEAIKPSILDIFPLEIPSQLEYKFPRYFRMEVEF